MKKNFLSIFFLGINLNHAFASDLLNYFEDLADSKPITLSSSKSELFSPTSHVEDPSAPNINESTNESKKRILATPEKKIIALSKSKKQKIKSIPLHSNEGEALVPMVDNSNDNDKGVECSTTGFNNNSESFPLEYNLRSSDPLLPNSAATDRVKSERNPSSSNPNLRSSEEILNSNFFLEFEKYQNDLASNAWNALIWDKKYPSNWALTAAACAVAAGIGTKIDGLKITFTDTGKFYKFIEKITDRKWIFSLDSLQTLFS